MRKRGKRNAILACVIALAMVAGLVPAPVLAEAVAEAGEAFAEGASPDGVGTAERDDAAEAEEPAEGSRPEEADDAEGAEVTPETEGGEPPAPARDEAEPEEGGSGEEVGESSEEREAVERTEAEQREETEGGSSTKDAPEAEKASGESKEPEAQESSAIAADPRVVADSSMESGQVATWDCVWLGSYPQAEVTASDAEYNGVVNAAFDSRGDATVDGQRYRRISRADVTNEYYWADDGYGSASYRYFRWEPIKWRVLEVSGPNALVMADVALDDQRYNANYTDVTWETSSVRSWLNGYGAEANQPGTDYASGNFYNSAFATSEERSAVNQSTVANADNQYYGMPGGNDTTDRVFLLSESEAYGDGGACHGFSSDRDANDEARRCRASDYSHAMGAWRSIGSGYKGNCVWWLRSPGYTQYSAADVGYGGFVFRDGYYVGNVVSAIRPALNLNLESPAVSSAGTVSSNGDVDETPAPRTGTVEEPVRITSLALGQTSYAWDGTAKRPGVTVTAGGEVVPSWGYTLAYKNNVNVGTATVTVTGRGDYTGSKSAIFKINKAASKVSLAAQTKTYNGKAQAYTGKVARSGSAGKVTYAYYSDAKCSKRVEAASVRNAGIYYVKATLAADANHKAATSSAAKLTIARAGLAKATLSKVANQAYTGKAVKPRPAVKLGGATLKLNTDYTLSYKSNVKAGTATVVATGKGNYSGTKSATFKIVAPSVQYHVHRQTYGNEPAWSKSDGAQSGTVGESKRLEAIWVRLGSTPVGGSIKYQTHIQGIGWQGWRSDGDMSGTAGQSRRLEAIRNKLTGDMAKRYDVYYRVHAQRFGWMGWAKNGASAGTAGYSYRLEAIQIVLVPKGGRVPDATYKGATRQYAEAFAQR